MRDKNKQNRTGNAMKCVCLKKYTEENRERDREKDRKRDRIKERKKEKEFER
jgi:hypothetical protein